MKSPHISPEPPPFLTDAASKPSEKSASRSTGSLKTGWTGRHFMYKKKTSTLTKENLEVFNNSHVEDKKYPISPYYKGLLFTEKTPGTSSDAEEATPVAHDFQNLNSPSPYYKGLLYTEKIPCTTLEAEPTAAMQHDFINTYSPYYKGLLNQATSPDRESIATTVISSSSRTSFSVKMQEWSVGCFLFRAKDEKPPTMVKVYSTENSNQESLGERGSEPASPRPSPTLQPPPSSSPSLSTPLSSTHDKKVDVDEEDTSEPKNEMKYIWADRYRPDTLKDFICNKDKAMER